MARITKKTKVNLVLDQDGAGKIVRLRLDFTGGQDDRADAVCDFLCSVAECAELSLVYSSDGDKGCPCVIVDCTPETQEDIRKMREANDNDDHLEPENIAVNLADGRKIVVRRTFPEIADDLISAGVSISEGERIISAHCIDGVNAIGITPEMKEGFKKGAKLLVQALPSPDLEAARDAVSKTLDDAALLPLPSMEFAVPLRVGKSDTFHKTIRNLDGFSRAMELHNTEAMHSVVYERIRQDKKWGEQNHNPERYLLIIAEEFGETAQAILHTLYGGPEAGIDRIRKELVETAATALAGVEAIDRGLFAWPVTAGPLEVVAQSGRRSIYTRYREGTGREYLCTSCNEPMKILDRFALRYNAGTTAVMGEKRQQDLTLFMCCNEGCKTCKKMSVFYDLGGVRGIGDPSGFYSDDVPKPGSDGVVRAGVEGFLKAVNDIAKKKTTDDGPDALSNALNSIVGENDFPPHADA